MKCTIPEISWHNREPVLSVDIHPISNDFYKLASGGGDSHILIWQMVLCENGSVKQELISDLTRHQKSVNSVRWSPSGQYLASADDDANIIVWQLKNDNIPLLDGNTDDKETWNIFKILRGHKEDIYDLCWSIDNMKLLTGSVDNTAILWDVLKGKMEHILSDHKGFVQGVAWDPKNQILATISTDRICRIFDVTGKQVKTRISKGKLPVPTDSLFHDKESKFFHDDTFKSFFRRLQFTPDGSLLIVPSGFFQVDDCKKHINSTLVFTMDNWSEPAAVLPLENQSSTVVRCCPLLFHQRDDGPDPLVKLPYRMIFAVGTDHDIILYDTQQSKPFARFHQIHYTRITDLTWSADGLLLIASSTDGFCSLITFEPEELGKVYIKEESDEEVNNLTMNESLESSIKDENVDITNKSIKEETKKENVKKRPSFIQQWVQNTPKKQKKDNEIIKTKEIIIVDDADKISTTKIESNTFKKSPINKEINKQTTENKIPEEDNTEPIEIREEQSKTLSKAIKDEINKLLPRKATSNVVNEIRKFTNCEAKPIEVGRKPRVINTNNKEIVKHLQIKIERISEVSHRRITPTKVGESSAVKSETAIQPTSVKKKLIKDTTKETPINKDELGLIKTDGKDENINLKGDKNNTNTKSEDDSKTSQHEVAKENHSEIKNEIIVLDEDTEEKDNKSKTKTTADDHKSKTKSNILNEIMKQQTKKTSLHKKSNEITANKNTSTQNSSTCKKKELTKIKVGSLIPKRVNKTPVKSNPLLEFLKNSGERKKAKTGVTVQKIDLTLDEDEARDGFVEEYACNTTTNNKDVSEESTEDFHLQLEDTQENKVEKETNCEKMKVDSVPEDKLVDEVRKISDDTFSPKINKTEEIPLQKKPRRVQLITLASPKGKKKPVMLKENKE